ncbi:type II toxin-antitoxin system ParD family antitoxin [Candidatus Nitrospira salsa]
MPNIDLGDPYETYVKGLLHTGLYSTYAEVGKDVIRLHMNHETNAKRLASINAALADGEADIQAGRVKTYSPRLINQLTDEVLHKEKIYRSAFGAGTKGLQGYSALHVQTIR